MRRAPAWPEVCVGIGVLALAALVGVMTLSISTPAYVKIGPAIAPWGVAAGLAVLGGILVLMGLRGGWEREADFAIDWRALIWLGAGLILNLVLIDGLSIGGASIIPRIGFIISSSLMFVCTARAFGSDRLARDTLIGFALAVISYIAFDRVLDYKIGSGIIEGLL